MTQPEAIKTLAVVSHCPSENTKALRSAIENALEHQTLEQTQFISLAALDTSPEDILKADAVLLFTTENLGYMSGGMKDFFDRCYYPCLEVKQGLPAAAIVRAGHDGTGTVRALETVLTGLKWRWVQKPLVLRGEFKETFFVEVEELASALACALDQGIV